MPASVLRNARRFLFSSAQNTCNLQWKLEVDMLCQTKIQMFNLDILQERIQGDLDYNRAQDISKECSMTA